jgi:hypothetical protein
MARRFNYGAKKKMEPTPFHITQADIGEEVPK